MALSILLLLPSFIEAQTTVSGQVLDGNEPLVGANLQIVGTTQGTTTDANGKFSITSSKALPWTLNVSFYGYETRRVAINVASSDLKIALKSSTNTLDDVIISASRKPEKIQEAPTSTYVLTERKLEVSAQAADPARNLVNVPGVQTSQQGASRLNIELRGQSALFNTGVFPIMDYRSLVGPGIGTFQSSNVGISNLDLDRIEVVRGPGSALYGPGVVTGVIHFITKSPIDHPGTSIELFGGELNTFGGALRHAYSAPSKKFGFKVNAQYRRGGEFVLGEEDSLQIAKFQTQVQQPAVSGGVVSVTQPGEILYTREDLDPDGDGNMMAADWYNLALNTTFEFRPQEDFNISLSGGYNQGKELFYQSQGEGLFQSAEYWAQARAQKGGFFGQVFYVDNDGGTKERPTFLYQTGNRTPVARKQFEAQLQYNFEIPILNAEVTTGLDFRQARSDSEHLVYGRNEADDDYSIFGGYVQSKFALGSKVDLVAAARYDVFNFLDEGFLSPRLALVYKANPKHTFRATFNKASTPPTALNVNIDFPVASPVPGLFDLWLTGTKESHTWDNPMIDFTAPGIPDLPYGTPGLPLAIPFGAVNQAVIEALGPALGTDPHGIADFLRTFSPGGTTGTFAPYNIFTGEPLTELVPTDKAKLTEINSYEVGYKGLIADKLGVTLDVYYNQTKGFTLFTAVGPTIALVNSDIPTDLRNAVAAGLTDHLMNTVGLDAITTEAIVNPIAEAYRAGGSVPGEQLFPLFEIFGAVESDLMPDIEGVHVPIGYRSFADASFDYVGTDLGLEYYVNSELSFFFNYSWLSQNVWEPGQSDDDGLPFRFTLNTPKNKFRLGAIYAPLTGVRGSLAFQHDDSFYADFGQFAGDTDPKNLVDLSVGYKMKNGLAIDLTATNLFNNEYRAFNLFPKIGRRVLAKITYHIGAGDK